MRFGFADGTMRCERRGCSNTFVPRARGGKPQRFCCRNCAAYEYNHSRGIRRRTKLEQREECPAGHPRRPWNTYLDPEGVARCRICQSAARRKYDRRTRAAAKVAA